MEDQQVRNSKKWIQELSRGEGSQVEILASMSLEIVHMEMGFIRCHFKIPDRLSDDEGNWHVGAMAILVDNIAGTAVSSFAGELRPTITFSMSYYSTAKVQEEVEIEAKVIAEKGRLVSVIIEIRRKQNGELIALGKQWTAADARASESWSSKINNKIKSSPISKL